MYSKGKKNSFLFTMHCIKGGEFMAVAIETWAGYNDEGEEIKRFKAADATNDIDPEEIKTAIENVKQQCDDEFKSISSKLTGLTDGALNALRIEGATLQEYIDQISEIVNQFGADIADKLEPLIEKAQEEHDRLQTEYNKDAKSKASSGSASCKQV